MKKTILAACCAAFALTSCDSFFEPNASNKRGEDALIQDPNTMRGFLTYAYEVLPTTYENYSGEFLDCATDNAVTIAKTGAIAKMASTEAYLTSTTHPMGWYWSDRYQRIYAVNDFLERGLDTTLVYRPASDLENSNYIKRLEGEAYFLRAYAQFDLLRWYGGVDTNDELKGFPIMTSTMSMDDERVKTMERNSYDECVDQIVKDIDAAISCGGLKEAYTGNDPVFGADYALGRPTTIAANLLRSRVLLYAASPAFSLDPAKKVEKYEAAAKAAKEVIDSIGGALPKIGYTKPAKIGYDFYTYDEHEELILRRVAGGTGTAVKTYAVEQRNFPAAVGLKGNAKCNPSQNLVDAFPTLSGYPIDKAPTGDAYDPTKSQFAGRDPRLACSVMYNGSSISSPAVTLGIYPGGNCGLGGSGITDANMSRTGYYLRKWVSEKVNVVSKTGDLHYYAAFRAAEAFLNFAEAANEAVGPDAAIDGMTAREAIRAIRKRAGIGGSNDPYLTSLTTKEEMRELIRNERRIELCFEDHRFFDIRRWKDMDALQAVVKGVNFASATDMVGVTKDVATLVYKDYMIYNPIPNEEILRCPTITQNKGW